MERTKIMYWWLLYRTWVVIGPGSAITIDPNTRQQRPLTETKNVLKASYARLFAVCVVVVSLVSTVQAADPVSPPNPPVIFVHYDYMGTSPYGYDLRPDPQRIARVVEAFRLHGIQLVIDPQQTVLPYHHHLSFGPCPPGYDDCVNFFDFKAQYFHPKGNLPWHYAIFGDAVGLKPDSAIVSGSAELPGYNFMVTIGPEQSCPDPSYGNLDLCQNAVVGTFMHELGHNLDLRHGGGEDQNFKPNYLSVMNYLWQTLGIPFSDAPGSVNVVGLRLDYSDIVLPTLDENHLDERVGLGGASSSRDISLYYDLAYNGYFVPVAAGPVDWNQNAVIEPDVQVDLNVLDEFPVRPYYSQLPGYDDWSHVQQWIRTPAYVVSLIRRGPAVP